MTLQQAAQAAIDVQDACNLSGVVRSFHEILSDVLWPEARRTGQGTEWVNTHPISVMFASKIDDLTSLFSSSEFCEAYDECKKLASEEITLKPSDPITDYIAGR